MSDPRSICGRAFVFIEHRANIGVLIWLQLIREAFIPVASPFRHRALFPQLLVAHHRESTSVGRVREHEALLLLGCHGHPVMQRHARELAPELGDEARFSSCECRLLSLLILDEVHEGSLFARVFFLWLRWLGRRGDHPVEVLALGSDSKAANASEAVDDDGCGAASVGLNL